MRRNINNHYPAACSTEIAGLPVFAVVQERSEKLQGAYHAPFWERGKKKMFTNSTFSPFIMNVSPGPGQYYVLKSGSWIIRKAEVGTVLVVNGEEWYYDPDTEKWYNDPMFEGPGYDYPPGAPQP